MKKLIASVLAAAALAGAATPALAAWGTTDTKNCKIDFRILPGQSKGHDFNGIWIKIQVDGDFMRATYPDGTSVPMVTAGTNKEGTKFFRDGFGELTIGLATDQGGDYFIVFVETKDGELTLMGDCR